MRYVLSGSWGTFAGRRRRTVSRRAAGRGRLRKDVDVLADRERVRDHALSERRVRGPQQHVPPYRGVGRDTGRRGACDPEHARGTFGDRLRVRLVDHEVETLVVRGRTG